MTLWFLPITKETKGQICANLWELKLKRLKMELNQAIFQESMYTHLHLNHVHTPPVI